MLSESPAMSSGLVRCAFHSVLEEIEPLSPRADRTKEIGTDILERASADDEALTAFDEFSVRITACLRGIYIISAQCYLPIVGVEEREDVDCFPSNTLL